MKEEKKKQEKGEKRGGGGCTKGDKRTKRRKIGTRERGREEKEQKYRGEECTAHGDTKDKHNSFNLKTSATPL